MTDTPEVTQADHRAALPPLQAALEQIFTDAGGSDMLVDLLAAFNFESSRELAEVMNVTMSDCAALQADNARLREALECCPPTSNPEITPAKHLERINAWWTNWARPALTKENQDD